MKKNDKVQHLRNVPKLRFEIFTKEYKSFNLGNVTDRITRKNKIGNNNNLTISAQYGLVNQKDFFNREIASKDNSHYYLLEKGDFAYNKSYSNGYPAGVVRRLDDYETGVVSTLYICFKPTSNLNTDYLLHYFESGKLNHKLLSISQEGARNHGLLNISIVDFFKDIHLYLPKLDEQAKISKNLSILDNKIYLIEKKLENLKLFKKGLRYILIDQKIIFNNIKTESIWSETFIGEIFSERSSRCQGKEKLLSVTINEGVILRSKIESKDNSSEDKSNYKQVKLNDMVYNSMRMWQGANGISKYEGIVSPAYTVLKPNFSICPDFFGFLFKSPNVINQFRRYSQGLTKDTWNLKYKQIKDIKVAIPSLEYQKRIVTILTSIDKKIDIEEEKLEILKQFKKGLLQQMFV